MPDANMIQGLRSRSSSATVVTVGEGYARDTTDAVFLTIPANTERTVDITVAGAGGLASGTTRQANKSYALWIVGAPGNDVVLGSAGFTVATAGLPANAKVRRIGSFATDAQSNVIPFRQLGTGRDREVGYNADASTLSLLQGGSATAWTKVKFLHLAPVTLETVFVGVTPSGSPVIVRTESSPEVTFAAPGWTQLYDGTGLELEYRNTNGGGSTDLTARGYTETL